MTSKVALVAAIAAAALSLAACGSKSDDDPTVSAPGGTTAPATTAGSEQPAGDTNGCDGDAAGAVKKAVTSSAVQKIEVIGGCSMVSIRTSLGPTAKADGLKICEDAAKVAYTGAVMSVSVDGADGHELAAGIKGSSGCI